MMTKFHEAHLQAIAADQEWSKAHDAQQSAFRFKTALDLDAFHAARSRVEAWNIVRYAGASVTAEEIKAAYDASALFASSTRRLDEAKDALRSADELEETTEREASEAWERVREIVEASETDLTDSIANFVKGTASASDAKVKEVTQ